MTAAAFQQILDGCDFRQPNQVSELVTATHTNVMFNEKVEERQVKNPLGAYNYFGGLFGKEVWPDGQGMDLVREYYTDPHVPFTFSHFVRQSAICDPNNANECNRTRCEIPEGGRGTMPGFVFYKYGFKTPRDCIANIRHIRQFRWWASRVIRARELIDEQVMNMFYTMAGIHTAGQKITMQGYRDTDGLMKMLPSADPRNPLRAGLFNYMEEKFPSPNNINLIAPLTVDTLDGLQRFWGQFPKNNEAAKGPRGENIYEFWYPDDWYQAEAIRNADYMEKLKILLPAKLFSGTIYADGDREVVGNFAPRVMPWLPRFAPTSTGTIVPVDTHVGIDIEVGKEYVGSVDFENAPLGMAAVVSGKQGTILSRPPLTTSGAGFPIMPITGDSGWVIRNDYDATCNADLNQPFSQKDYEMGIRMDDPQAAVAFLFRRRLFQTRPINECDLAPIFTVTDNEITCALTTIGCGDNQRRENDNIVDVGGPTYVECFSQACGNAAHASPYAYIIKVARRANEPDFNSLQCACGDTVNLFIYDEDGHYNSVVQGVVKSDIAGFPYARYIVETTDSTLHSNPTYCIKGISCVDSTPTVGNVLDAWDTTTNHITVLLSELIANCDSENDSVIVTWYDPDGNALGHLHGHVDSANLETFIYVLEGDEGDVLVVDAFDGWSYMTVTCDQGA